MCDNSCSLSESAYQERTQRLAELYNNITVGRVNTTKHTPDNHEQSQ